MKKYIHIKYALCQLGNFACFLIGCGFFIKYFQKLLSGLPSEIVQQDPDHAQHFIGLIWVETVCKGSVQECHHGVKRFGWETEQIIGPDLCVQTFCNLNFFQKCYQSVKRYGSRSGSRSMVLPA